MPTHISKFAPVRSSLLTKHMRGTLSFSAWRQTVSDCGSTPATPSKQATAPSSTRKLRSTSMVKSTWPGGSVVVVRGSAPAGRRPRLDPGDSIEAGDRAVEHSQAALDLDGEVDVAGRVDDVDPVLGALAFLGRAEAGRRRR